MDRIPGKVIYSGIEIGKAYFYREARRPVVGGPCLSVQEEEQRLVAAIDQVIHQLDQISYAQADLAAINIYEQLTSAYKVLLKDEIVRGYALRMIREEKCNAQSAVMMTGEHFYRQFLAMEDAYIRARAQDIRDLADRVLAALDGQDTSEKESMPMRCILCADSLSPAQVMRLDRSGLLGIVVKEGSLDSHAAILARTWEIPTLIVPDLNESIEGKEIILDAVSGVVIVEPDAQTKESLSQCIRAQHSSVERLQDLIGKPNVTRSGRHIQIYANIGDVADLSSVLRNDAGGIGLFRSEFLYMGRTSFPTEEEQFESYAQAARVMDGKPVVIRTMDIGADKQAEYFQLAKEQNPAMGKRAIRLSLERREIFMTQLRAILRASAYGNVAILYPMIISISEFDKIQELLNEARMSLARDGIRFGNPQQGVMIETPAAAMISDMLAKRVDFFSIGTNDLTQYTLALDRGNASLDAYYDPYHEAVLRMIRMTTENAHKEGIPVTVCGELGADRNLTDFFLNIGVDGLSVSPSYVLRIREALTQME